MNIKDIRELILTIDKTNIQKVEIEEKDIRISISKSTLCENKNSQIKEEQVKQKIESEKNEKNIDHTDDEFYIVKSPIVGAFYAAPSPESKPFAKVGDEVVKGQTLCIIEAMKIMNEIESEVSGKVVEILVDNEDAVEYGQPLMKIRR